MAKKEIQFSLVYRDMWQSSGKYVPRKDQLAKIAPVIIDMGCFDRVETNGGAEIELPQEKNDCSDNYHDYCGTLLYCVFRIFNFSD